MKMLFKGNSSRLELLIEKIQSTRETTDVKGILIYAFAQNRVNFFHILIHPHVHVLTLNETYNLLSRAYNLQNFFTNMLYLL